MNTKDMQFISFLDKVKTAEHASLIESIKTAYATIVENEVTSVEDYSDIMALWRAAEEAEAAHRKALRELGSKLGPVLKSIKTSSDWGDFMSAPAIRSASPV